jgi:hypothetical protein
MERFNLKTLKELVDKEQYCIDISNRLGVLKTLDAKAGIHIVWETIRENIKISAKECLGYCILKKHKPWYDEVSQNHWIKENMQNCSGYCILVK